MLVFILTTLLITPPLLWLIGYKTIEAQDNPDTDEPMTQKQARSWLIEKTLCAPITKCWFVYAILMGITAAGGGETIATILGYILGTIARVFM